MKSDSPKTSSGVLYPDTDAYPDVVAQCVTPAPPLYYRGNLALLTAPHHLAVIGSRQLTNTNEQNIRFILEGLRDTSLCIVSGLALGIDALAHEIALSQGIPTIAIPGSSVEPAEVYPRSNARLAERIVNAGGLLLSPFPPRTKIMPFNFPIRNQLIAGLAQAIIVGSAARTSGALITARLGLEYGKDVFAVPGSLFDPLYEGCNELLKQGAQPVTSSHDILDYFGMSPVSAVSFPTDDPIEQKLLSELRMQPLTAQEISLLLAQPQSATQALITKLELRGWITKMPNGSLRLGS